MLVLGHVRVAAVWVAAGVRPCPLVVDTVASCARPTRHARCGSCVPTQYTNQIGSLAPIALRCITICNTTLLPPFVQAAGSSAALIPVVPLDMGLGFDLPYIAG